MSRRFCAQGAVSRPEMRLCLDVNRSFWFAWTNTVITVLTDWWLDTLNWYASVRRVIACMPWEEWLVACAPGMRPLARPPPGCPAYAQPLSP